MHEDYLLSKTCVVEVFCQTSLNGPAFHFNDHVSEEPQNVDISGALSITTFRAFFIFWGCIRKIPKAGE